MPVRTNLSLSEFPPRVEAWLETTTGRVGCVIGAPTIPQENGMVAPTILFDIQWEDTGEVDRFVLRGDIDDTQVPRFDTCSLELQYRLMQALADTAVPVPSMRWWEPDPTWLGMQFFVMDRVDGLVAADQPPYIFGGWLAEGTAEERAAVEHSTITALARIHSVGQEILTDQLGAALTEMSKSAATALDRARQRYEWGRRGQRSELLEELIRWCENHLPETESDDGLCWGDSRVGNLMFKDHEVVAVLDWDQAAVGPRELDVAWMIVFHAMFQEAARTYELQGLPDMFVRQNVIEAYERAAGVELRPLQIYEGLAALKLAVGSLRGHHLEVYGHTEDEPIDNLVVHKQLIRELIS